MVTFCNGERHEVKGSALRFVYGSQDSAGWLSLLRLQDIRKRFGAIEITTEGPVRLVSCLGGSRGVAGHPDVRRLRLSRARTCQRA